MEAVTAGGGGLTKALNDVGKEGWEVAAYMPALEPTREAIGWLVLKRAY